MKKTALLVSLLMAVTLVTGCGNKEEVKNDSSAVSVQSVSEVISESSAVEERKILDIVEDESETEETSEEFIISSSREAAESALEDGVYEAAFETDSTMFHVNEALDGKGTLTVKDGQMTIHISLVSKRIVNLYLGLAEDAEEADELIEPTEDEITYKDGMTDTVYGFDVPVPVLEEEFDLAILGKKGIWYDHKVSVKDVTPVSE